MNKPYKAFGFEFNPSDDTTNIISIRSDVHKKINLFSQSVHPCWLHFENPSKNLQSQLSKKLSIPKSARTILFADEVRSRCMKVDNDYIFIVHGIQPSNIDSDANFPSIRFWLTQNRLLSISTNSIDSIAETYKELKIEPKASTLLCMSTILHNLIYSLEQTIHDVDEELYKIELKFEFMEQTSTDITLLRQDIIYLRRYILPQRDAFINIANKVKLLDKNIAPLFKELSDSMIRHSESIEMLRERASILQDHLTNQIAELTNQRVYVVTIIMLIFTPAFFIMGLFSMYIPMPGMDNKWTWWGVCGIITCISYGLYRLFKKRGWI